MKTLIRPALTLFILLSVITGLLYPLLVTGICRALSALDRIAAEHPEIRHRGQPWANDMKQLQETIMTPGKKRIAKYRAKQREKRMKTVNVFLTAEAQVALNRVSDQRKPRKGASTKWAASTKKTVRCPARASASRGSISCWM